VRFDVAANTEVDRVTVGAFPFDVDVMKVRVGGVTVERAYVANHGNAAVSNDDTLSIVNPSNFTATPGTVILNQDFQPPLFPADLHLERIAGNEVFEGGQVRSKLLYLVSGPINRVLVYDLAGSGDAPVFAFQFPAGPDPGDIALQIAAP
jgi:hypothetical protein